MRTIVELKNDFLNVENHVNEIEFSFETVFIDIVINKLHIQFCKLTI